MEEDRKTYFTSRSLRKLFLLVIRGKLLTWLVQRNDNLIFKVVFAGSMIDVGHPALRRYIATWRSII